MDYDSLMVAPLGGGGGGSSLSSVPTVALRGETKTFGVGAGSSKEGVG